jgi:hypothetical protein
VLQASLSRLKWVQKFHLGRILSISFRVEDAAFVRDADHAEVESLRKSLLDCCNNIFAPFDFRENFRKIHEILQQFTAKF